MQMPIEIPGEIVAGLMLTVSIIFFAAGLREAFVKGVEERDTFGQYGLFVTFLLLIYVGYAIYMIATGR